MEERAVVLEDVRRLGDGELIAGLRGLVRSDRALTARLLVHLGEVDSRGLYRERAFDSMFAYAVQELHMSEAEAYLRIQAARLGRAFPLVVEMLAKGELHLTAIKLLGPHLRSDNHAEVLARARFKGKREIELIVAELAPKPDVPSTMRKLPVPVAERATAVSARPMSLPLSEASIASMPRSLAPDAPRIATMEVCDRGSSQLADRPLGKIPANTVSAATHVTTERNGVFAEPGVEPSIEGNREAFQLKPTPASVSSTTPLSARRYKVVFTAEQATHDKFERLANLLRHQVPDGNLAVILDRAADALIEKIMKNRFAQTMRKTRRRAIDARPRASQVDSRSAERDSRVIKQKTIEAGARSELTEPRALDGKAPPTEVDYRSGTETRMLEARPLARNEDFRSELTEPRMLGARPLAREEDIHSELNEARLPEERPVRGDEGPRDDDPGSKFGEPRTLEVRPVTKDEGFRSESAAPRTLAGNRVLTNVDSISELNVPRTLDPTVLVRAPRSDLTARTLNGTSLLAQLDSGLAARESDATATSLPTQVDSRCAETTLDRVDSSQRAIQSRSRYVPRSVIREVYARDGEQCTFVCSDGRRCSARSRLELHHHDVPYAKGGPATAANLRLVCRAHNGWFAEKDFGRAFMQSKLVQSRSRKGKATDRLVPERAHE